MRQLTKDDLQLAKDVLCAFEEKHVPNKTVCADIQEGLYWDENDEEFEADLGLILRGETYGCRIYETDDDWLGIPKYESPIAFVEFKGKFYFFYTDDRVH